jgi:hypothetical protein
VVLLLLLPIAHLSPEATAAFDRYVARAEANMISRPVRDPRLKDGQPRIEADDAAHQVSAPGAMIQDWVGTLFMPGATLERVRAVLQDYPNYKNFYQPRVIESREVSHSGNEYDVTLRLYEKYVVTVVLNSDYHVRYELPDAQHLVVTSHSTRVGEVKDPAKSYEAEAPPGQDSGFLWRLNSYWRFEAADGGVYGRCEAISLSRDVPWALGFLKGFLVKFPRDSMENTLRGTAAAVRSRGDVTAGLAMLSVARGTAE